MNRKLGLSVLGAALVAATAFSLAGNPPGQSDLQKEVDRLRADVNELKKKSADADVKEELKKTQAQLVETQSYLVSLGESSQALAEALNDAEKKGFTFGINPDSRIALLQGLHEFCDSLHRNVPGAKEKAGEGANGGR